MKRICKIRFYPNKRQRKTILKTLGCCRFIKNKYIEYCSMEYKLEGKFLGYSEFCRIINKLKKRDPDFEWINGISTKAITHAAMEEEERFIRFFEGGQGYPRFISGKKVNKESYFFVKNHVHFDTGNKYIISIPILGKVRILQREYLPNNDDVTSGRILREGNKFYLLFRYNYYPEKIKVNKQIKMGIDLGLSKYATIYLNNGTNYTIKHYKTGEKYKEIKGKIIKLQQIMDHKAFINYNKFLNVYMDKHSGDIPNDTYKKILIGKAYKTSRIRNLRKKFKKLHEKLTNIRKDFINKLVYNIVTRTKPRCIVIEDIIIRDLYKTGTHHKNELLQDSAMYYFRVSMINKCFEYGVELRLADLFIQVVKYVLYVVI